MVAPVAIPRLTWLAVVFALFLPPCVVAAAALSDSDLLRGSSLVVDARVAKLTPHWNERHDLILTTVDLDVSSTIFSRGPSVGRHCALEVLGGEIDGVGLAISEGPRFTPGERIIAFVRSWDSDRLTVTGGAVGLFHIDRTGRVEGRAMGAAQYAARIRALAK